MECVMFEFRIAPAAILAALALSVSAARAADLPPPPPVEQVAPIVFETSGWYLRGDIGYGWYNNGDFYQYELATSSGIGVWDNIDGGDGVVADVGIGYKFNNWFRADATVGYRFDHDVTGHAFLATNPAAENWWYGKVNNTVLLANGYIDLGTWGGFTPYVGAGIGAAYTNSSWNPLVGTAPGVSGWNLAWALMAGFSYAVSSNLAIDIGYRYIHLGDTNSGAFSCPNSSCTQTPVYYKDMAASDVRVGLRWTFASGAPVVPAAAPVVAKY
jgi:opacity protein-like surface antigen